MPSADAVVLPANVIPVKYRMTLQPDLETFTFRGEQTVDIDIQTPHRTNCAERCGTGNQRCDPA